jgi:hypothetical protein
MEHKIQVQSINTLISNKNQCEDFVNLYTECLGKDIYLLNNLKANNSFIATLTDSTNKLFGFLVFFIAYSSTSVKKILVIKPLKQSLEYPCAVVFAAAVDKNKRRKGFANSLFLAMEDFLVKEKIDNVMGAALEYNGIIPADSNFKKLGYQALERMITPWKADCDATAPDGCPHRDNKNHRCICNAIVYYKTNLIKQMQILVA